MMKQPTSTDSGAAPLPPIPAPPVPSTGSAPPPVPMTRPAPIPHHTTLPHPPEVPPTAPPVPLASPSTAQQAILPSMPPAPPVSAQPASSSSTRSGGSKTGFAHQYSRARVSATHTMRKNGITSSSDARLPLPAGTIVGDYTISSQIGIGGFGITYFAKHTVEGTPVAIKEHMPEGLAIREPNSTFVIHSSPEEETRFKATLEEFQEEVTVLMGLSHPGIIPILSAFTANGTAYYVMPFQEGTPMSIVEQATLDQAQQAQTARHNKRLLLSMLSTLDYLRMHQIVHRDIKTDNILVSPEGNTILLDFGSARQLQPGKVFTNVYTPDFSAPEQSRAKSDEEMSETIGPWTDLYALGVCFYYLITHLFPPRSDLRVLATVDPYTPLAGRADLEKLYGSAFLKAIDRALELKIRDRWHSAHAWRMAIEDGVVSKAPKETRRRVAIFSIFSIIFIILGSVCLWALNEKARAEKAIDNSMRFVEHMLNDFNQELSDIPGSTRLQRIFGHHLNSYLNGIEMPNDGVHDEMILRSLTASWRNYGSVCLQQGRLEEADASFNSAIGYLRQLCINYPDTLSYSYDLANILLLRVEIARNRNQHDLVKKYLTEAFDILYKLCRIEPFNPEFTCASGQALSEEARLARIEGKLDQYKNSLTSMLIIFRDLQDKYPDYVGARENLGYALESSAQYAIEQGNFSSAATYLDESKSIFSDLSAQYPYRLSFQKGLALTFYSLGILYDRQSIASQSEADRQRYNELAIAALRKHIELVNHLETQDENKAEYPYMACRALATMVDILLRTGQPNLAEAYSNTIMRKTRKLRHKAKDNMDYAIMEANAWRGLAIAHGRAPRYAVKASDEFTKYRKCVEQLLQQQPQNNNIQFTYIDALTESASHALITGQVVQARRWLQQAQASLSKLLEAAPDNTAYSDQLQKVNNMLQELPAAPSPQVSEK